LAKACIDEQSILQKEGDKASFVVMDGLSLREGVLIYDMLKREGYEARMSYAFSAVPSEKA